MIYDADKKYYNGIKNFLDKHRFNNKVFITPPWKEIYRQDDERDQTYEEAEMVYQKLYGWYGSNGYDRIIIPKTSVDMRLDFVLHQVQKQLDRNRLLKNKRADCFATGTFPKFAPLHLPDIK